jgi:hypothetical protein
MDRVDTVSYHQTLSADQLSNVCNRSVCVLLVGACTGPVFDRGHLRFLLLIGSFGVVFGFMMLSLCKEFWQAVLAQGFCIGLGGGMLFVPSVAILPTYFSTKIGLAIGLAAAGSSMGGKFTSPHADRVQMLTLLLFVRYHLPYCLLPLAATNRLRMVCPRSRVHGFRHSSHPHLRHEDARAATQGSLSARHDCVRRRTLHDIRHRSYDRLHRPIRRALLRFVLRTSDRHHQLIHVFLPGPDSERRISIRTNTAQHPVRQNRSHKRHHPRRFHLRHPRLLQYRSRQPRWHRRASLALRLLLGNLYRTAACMLLQPDRRQDQAWNSPGNGLRCYCSWCARWWTRRWRYSAG